MHSQPCQRLANPIISKQASNRIPDRPGRLSERGLADRILVLRNGALAAPGAHGLNTGGGALFVGTVGFGRELDEGVERNLQRMLA